MYSDHEWFVSIRLSGFGTFYNSTHACIMELLSDFHQRKTLRVSPLVCHFPFLPRHISEKTLGNFVDLLKIKPIALKAVGPLAAAPGSMLPAQRLPASVLCSMAPWAARYITSAAHPHHAHTLPSFHPLPPPLPWFHTSVPKFTLSSLFLSPPSAFFLTAGKNFVHTSSEPSTKLHFLDTTTCPSVSVDQDGGRYDQTAGTPAWVSAWTLLMFLGWGGCGAGWGGVSVFMEKRRKALWL